MDQDRKFEVYPGNPERLGVYDENGGLAFAFTVPDDLDAQLILTDPSGKEIISEIDLPVGERTGNVSSVYLKPLAPHEIGYYYRVNGEKVLDPFAPEIRDGVCHALADVFEWDDDRQQEIPLSELLIYKLHVRGFTKKAKNGGAPKGTFSALARRIPYIKDLGFNAVELMPVYEFDDRLKLQPFAKMKTKDGRQDPAWRPRNYWGYAEKNYYYSPKARYASEKDTTLELRAMIREFHRNGMECIMEIYFPEGTDPFTAVLAVRYWKSHYHMDGFHFIGAGTPVSSLVKDPLLVRTKLIFERVDDAQAYGGKVPKRRNLIACNDDFMHNARCLLKGDEGQIGEFAVNLRKNPERHGVVNYMAGNNGFTMYDMVSYDWKHNEANGEDNRDGTDFNFSWNCGVEGPTRKTAVLNLRQRQLRNAYLYTFLSQGIPLLLAGDESGNTQLGNNNAYASDDPVGWTDWHEGKRNTAQREFLKKLIAFRKAHPILHMEHPLRGMDYKSYGFPDVSFHDTTAWYCSFERASRSLGVMYCGKYAETEGKPADDFLYVAYNAYWNEQQFALPRLPEGFRWYLAIDSAAPAGKEFPDMEDSELPEQKYCQVPARATRVLIGRAASCDASSKKDGVRHESH